MITRTRVLPWLWKLPVCVAALFAGQMLGLALVSVLGLELPVPTSAADEGPNALLFVLAAIAITVALASMATGLAGRWWLRGAILAAFLFGVYGVGNTIESSVFTTLGGEGALLALHLPAAILIGIGVALLFPAPSDGRFRERATAFFARWSPAGLAARLALAVLAFPVFYFVFGMAVAPIVTPYYGRLDFLVIPPVTTMLTVVFIRSVLLLLVSLPVIIAWRATRGRLMLALSLGHFVALGLAGLLQATFFPPVLRWTHGVEILGGAVCYAVTLAILLVRPGTRATTAAQSTLRERLA
jgi:hypothetical protein